MVHIEAESHVKARRMEDLVVAHYSKNQTEGVRIEDYRFGRWEAVHWHKEDCHLDCLQAVRWHKKDW